MKVYLVRNEERERHIGLVRHKDYIFPTKELAVQFCVDNSMYKDEPGFRTMLICGEIQRVVQLTY